jgi:hypothetical protein
MRPMVLIGTGALLAAACSGGAPDSGDGASPSITPTTVTDQPATSPTVAAPSTTATEPTVEAPSTSEPLEPNPDGSVVVGGQLRYDLDLGMSGCERMTTATAVDADRAAGYVDSTRTIALSGGRAQFALSILACDDLQTDDRSHGPGHFATAWIKLADEAEPELPVGSQIDPTGTDFFAPVLFQTDNVGFAEATMDFGIPMTLASFEFGPTESGLQQGSVEQTWTTLAASYEWQVDNVEIGSSPNHIGVHTLVGTSNTPELPLVYVGEFVHATSGFYGNQSRVDIAPDSLLSPLLGDGFAGRGNGDAVDVDMVVMRFDPINAFRWSIGADTRAAGPDTRVSVRTPSEPCGTELWPAVVGTVTVQDELIELGNVVVGVQLVSEAAAALTTDKVADITRGTDQLGMAVAWLRAHADEYCVDPAAIAVSGHSWSGIAALSLAYATGEIEVGDLIEIDELGPPIEMLAVEPLPVMPTLADFSTAPNAAIAFGSFAPPDTIDPGEPPALLFNGTNDTSVPFALAEATCAEAAAAGVACEIVAHSDGHSSTPSGVDIVGIIDDFLDRL